MNKEELSALVAEILAGMGEEAPQVKAGPYYPENPGPEQQSEGGSAEERIRDSVRQNVGVRVSEKAEGMIDLDTAEDQLSPLNKAVHIITIADTDIHHSSSSVTNAHSGCSASIASAAGRSSGVVILILS